MPSPHPTESRTESRTDSGTDTRSAETEILVFAGSVRTGSLNGRLADAAAARLGEAGVAVRRLDLADYPLPLYDGDLEAAEGLPENARRLKQLFVGHPAFLIACPEYNSSITPLLKNTFDWVSRRDGDEPPLVAYRGKLAALVSASPGALGGLRGLAAVRSILCNIGVWVQPTQLAVGQAHQVLGEDGSIEDEKIAGNLQRVVDELAEAVRRRRA